MSIKYVKKKNNKVMYNHKKEDIDKKIITSIDDIFISNNLDKILLNDLACILKAALKENDFSLTYNGKVRNILSYIHKEHKSISKFIKKNTNYNLETLDSIVFISNSFT